MGCFDSRCAITNTSIGWQDPVLFMKMDAEFLYKDDSLPFPCFTYHLMGRISRAKQNKSELPWLFGHLEPEQILEQESGITVQWGTYNDYGWIEEEERNHDKKYVVAFVHEDVAKEICKDDDILSVLYECVVFAYLCRLSFHTNLTGRQAGDSDEFADHRKRVKLINMVLDRQEQQWQEDTGE